MKLFCGGLILVMCIHSGPHANCIPTTNIFLSFLRRDGVSHLCHFLTGIYSNFFMVFTHIIVHMYLKEFCYDILIMFVCVKGLCGYVM